MIVGLLNQKGGVGKTTLAVHLAMGLRLSGRSVLLVDADPQGSALDWSSCRESDIELPVIGLPTKNLHKELQAHITHFDDIVIDGPPRVNELARAAIFASDVVLIPVQPSPYDVWAAREITELLSEARIFKENLKSAFVINRKIANTAIGRDVTKALAEHEIPLLAQSICQRVAFAESAADGSTVLEDEPDSTASQEIRGLVEELIQFVKQKNKALEEVA